MFKPNFFIIEQNVKYTIENNIKTGSKLHRDYILLK